MINAELRRGMCVPFRFFKNVVRFPNRTENCTASKSDRVEILTASLPVATSAAVFVNLDSLPCGHANLRRRLRWFVAVTFTLRGYMMRIVTVLIAVLFAASTSTLAAAKSKHKTKHHHAAAKVEAAPADPNDGSIKLFHDFFTHQ